jgi:hypothetical protein
MLLLQKVREVITILMLLILTGVLVYGFVFLRKTTQTIVAVNTTMVQANKLLLDSQTKLDDLSYHANAILLETGLTMMEVRKASITETASLNQLSNQMNTLAGKLSITADSVNSTVLTIQQQAKNIGDSTTATVTDVQSIIDDSKITITDTNLTLVDLDKSINSLNDRINDPNISSTMVSVNETMTHVSSSTAKIDHQIDLLTKPKKLIVRIFNGLLGTAAKVAVIVK